MEKYFSTFRKHIIGINHSISTFYHKSIPIVYTDWTASGRLYQSIEDKLKPPEFLSTHPSYDTRILNLTKWAPEAKAEAKKFGVTRFIDN